MPDAAPKGKRKRGRPRKAKTPKPEDLDIQQAAEAGADAAGEPGPEPAPEPQAEGGSAPPPPGDTPPGEQGAEPRKPRGKRVTKKGTQQIEDALRELLQLPSVPAALVGDTWASNHFYQQGAALANKIAVVSERNPVLRRWCERMMEGESVAVLFMAGIMYAGPPLLHLGLVPGGEMIGIPVLRRPQGRPAHAPAPAPEQPAYGREAPEPQRHGEAPPPTTPPPAEGPPPTVAPEAHQAGFEADGYTPDDEQAIIWQGGENGEGPPTWQVQMMG